MFEAAIGLGVLVSLFFLETFGTTAGGIVVAGYIAVFLHQPWTVLGTLLISFAVYLVVKLLGRIMFIYGRRRMVISILLGFIFGWLVRTYGFYSEIPSDYSVNVIGYIIPGLIANAMAKQGITRTLTVMFVAAVVVRLLINIIFGGLIISIM